MSDHATTVLGIALPSSSPLFVSMVGVHVLIGLAAVIAGAVAIFSKKRRGQHPRFGVTYYWAVIATVATAAVLAAIRAAANPGVMALGALCLAAVIFGREAMR